MQSLQLGLAAAAGLWIWYRTPALAGPRARAEVWEEAWPLASGRGFLGRLLGCPYCLGAHLVLWPGLWLGLSPLELLAAYGLLGWAAQGIKDRIRLAVEEPPEESDHERTLS